jgi:hypothetical protein
MLAGSPTLSRPRSILRAVVGLLALLSILCTLFALVVTAFEGWREHIEAQWPEVTARVQGCAVALFPRSISNPKHYVIECDIRYPIREQMLRSTLRSRSTPVPSRLIWAYPADTFDRMQQWVAGHPAGTPLKVHYDPADPTQTGLLATDMPRGGARTPGNLKLLGGTAAICVVLLAAVYLARP